MNSVKRSSFAAFQSFNALRNLQGTPPMTEIDTDKLRALDEAATPELKTVSPRIMAQLLRLGAEHQRPRGKDWESAKFDADGLLISTLLNGLPAILAMAEERDRSEKHRNDFADMLIQKQTEIGALKAEVERLSRICASNAATMEEQAIRFRRLGKSTSELDAAVSETRRALGKDKA